MKLLIASLLVSSLPWLPVARQSAPVDVAQSIRHLSVLGQAEDTGEIVRHNQCGAFRLQTKVGPKWITANHCVETASEMGTVFIGSHKARVVLADPNIDMAILDGEEAPALTLASTAPQVGDPVTFIGFPYNWPVLAYRWGTMSTAFEARQNGVIVTALQLPAAPGDSGSPVFNAHMQVIGLMQAVFCATPDAFCPMSAMVSYDNVRYLLATLEKS